MKKQDNSNDKNEKRPAKKVSIVLPPEVYEVHYITRADTPRPKDPEIRHRKPFLKD